MKIHTAIDTALRFVKRAVDLRSRHSYCFLAASITQRVSKSLCCSWLTVGYSTKGSRSECNKVWGIFSDVVCPEEVVHKHPGESLF